MVDSSTTPAEVRQLIRQSDPRIVHTSGLCGGHLQANLVILPAERATTFARFVDANSQACPLLYRSQPGEVAAPPLAENSDITTDVPLYRVYQDGVLTSVTDNIKQHWRDDLVSFYFGCSYTFESALLAAGIPVRNMETGGNVPMYRTNIPCAPSGEFGCNMIVSMRPIPEGLLPKTREITGNLVNAHGAPVHAGNPSGIGIVDLDTPDFGDRVEVLPGEVPTFWACGVTSGEAVSLAVTSGLCITHSPGSMFVCDTKEDAPLVTGTGVSHRLDRLQKLMLRDPNHRRGVAHYYLPGELETAARTLLGASSAIALLTGNPVLDVSDVCSVDPDGPLGVLALHSALQHLHKDVHIAAPSTCVETLQRCLGVEVLDAGAVDWSQSSYSAVVVVGGAVEDGLVKALTSLKQVGAHTIAIGDTGSEVGMEAIRDLVVKFAHRDVPQGIVADSTITCGVSNWGAYALTGALAVLDRTLTTMVDVESQLDTLRRLVGPDGTLTVDGLPFNDDHRTMLGDVQVVIG